MIKQFSLLILQSVFILFSIFPTFGQNDTTSTFMQKATFIAPLFSYSVRDGYENFDELGKSIKIPRANLATFGLAMGLRQPVLPWLRLQLGLLVDFGTVTEDSMATTPPSVDKNYYYHIGLEPQLHCLLWSYQKVTTYAFAGAGVNGMYVEEHTFYRDTMTQEVAYKDRKYVRDVSFSWNGALGLGIDIAINERLAITINDSYRVLYPVSYKLTDDYPIIAMPYTEAHYGNLLFAGVTLKL